MLTFSFEECVSVTEFLAILKRNSISSILYIVPLSPGYLEFLFADIYWSSIYALGTLYPSNDEFS